MGGRRLAEAVTAADASGGFELEYCPSAGLARRAGLMACAGEPFEDALPVRPFHFEKGQSSFAGWWWLATTSLDQPARTVHLGVHATVIGNAQGAARFLGCALHGKRLGIVQRHGLFAKHVTPPVQRRNSLPGV